MSRKKDSVAPIKRGRGRPRKIAEDAESQRQIESMAGFGLTQSQISAIIGVSVDTLARRFPEAMAVGKAKAVAMVAQSLYKRAIAGDNQAAIFYLRSQAGWIDRTGVQVTGKNNGPLMIEGAGISGLLARARKPRDAV